MYVCPGVVFHFFQDFLISDVMINRTSDVSMLVFFGEECRS